MVYVQQRARKCPLFFVVGVSRTVTSSCILARAEMVDRKPLSWTDPPPPLCWARPRPKNKSVAAVSPAPLLVSCFFLPPGRRDESDEPRRRGRAFPSLRALSLAPGRRHGGATLSGKFPRSFRGGGAGQIRARGNHTCRPCFFLNGLSFLHPWLCCIRSVVNFCAHVGSNRLRSGWPVLRTARRRGAWTWMTSCSPRWVF